MLQLHSKTDVTGGSDTRYAKAPQLQEPVYVLRAGVGVGVGSAIGSEWVGELFLGKMRNLQRRELVKAEDLLVNSRWASSVIYYPARPIQRNGR